MAAMPTSPLPKFKDTEDAREAEMLAGRWPDRKPDNSTADLVGRLDEVLAVIRDQRAPPHSELIASPIGGIEARVAHLEASAAHLERDVTQMRTDVRDIRERLYRLQERATHLPTNGALTLAVVVTLAAIVSAAAFQQQIQAFLGAAFQ
ncbi:MAG: hypothetical protein M3453_09370 [Pseudomonadota bacterium]|jgi:hypothetical protein|nr:hypothetical protein [Pseudomonadota bacterium]